MKELLASTFFTQEDELFHEFEQVTNRQFYALLSMIGGGLAIFAGIVHLL